jgi:hypothetical protein
MPVCDPIAKVFQYDIASVRRETRSAREPQSGRSQWRAGMNLADFSPTQSRPVPGSDDPSEDPTPC